MGRRRRRGTPERARALAAGSVRSATSATGLALAPLPTMRGRPADDEVAGTADPGLAKDGVDLDLPPWQRGRYGTAIGRAVHAVLQDADLATGDDIDVLAAAQCAAEGIFGLEARVADAVPLGAGRADRRRRGRPAPSTGGSCSSSPSSAAPCSRGTSTCSCAPPTGLVIVDYKTDQWRPGADQRGPACARYRHQLAAYGLALGRLLDEPIAGGVLVRCRPDGPAEQIALADWAAALAEVAAAPRRPDASVAAGVLEVAVDVGPRAHRRPHLAWLAGRAHDRADALADAGEHPAHEGQPEDDRRTRSSAAAGSTAAAGPWRRATG